MTEATGIELGAAAKATAQAWIDEHLEQLTDHIGAPGHVTGPVAGEIRALRNRVHDQHSLRRAPAEIGTQH